MKTRTPITIALAAAAALGLGASVQAQQGYDPDYGQQPPDPGYQQGNQAPDDDQAPYPPDQAPYPAPDQAPYQTAPPYQTPPPGYTGPRSVRQLAVAAHEMDDAATYASRLFDRNNRRPDPNEARVSARLGQLAESARVFHREVAYSRGDTRRSQADFQRLVRAYERAADASRYISERPYVDESMERIGRRIDQTASIYGMNLSEMSRFRGEHRDRYGRYRRDQDQNRGYYDNGYPTDRDDGGVYVPSPPPPPPSR